MLESTRLFLKLISDEDTPFLVKWRSDKEIINKLFSYKGLTVEEHRLWYKKYIEDSSRIEFMILKKEDNSRIGTIGLSNIDYKNQKAEYGVLIGEKNEQGKGFSKEASLVLLSYAFKELNINKIYLRVFEDNIKAIELYIKIGFVQEGYLRSEYFKNGVYKDILYMSLLRKEWYKREC